MLIITSIIIVLILILNNNNNNISNRLNDNANNNNANHINNIFNNNKEEEISNNYNISNALNFEKISFSNDIINKKENEINKNICPICYESYNDKEFESDILLCGHFCCKQCWLNYLKSEISKGNTEEIKCAHFSCDIIISENFILEHIKDDQSLLEKYKKFKYRTEIFKDKNKKLCPHPDCDSYLQKSNKSKYVKCQISHEYCFECLKPPHGNANCQSLDKKFLSWKNGKRVKKCPRCEIFIEKNEGCNHMTCCNCMYQWCWLCEGKYDYDHYSSGKCRGHQYTRADNISDLNICCFTLESILPCFFVRRYGILNIEEIYFRYIAIFGMWIFGFFIFSGFTMYNYTSNKYHVNFKIRELYYIIGFFIALYLCICFQILFTIFISPLIIVSLIKHNFLDVIFNYMINK